MWIGMFLVFIAVPLLELATLIKLGQIIGLWPTILLLVLSTGMGLAILNAQGFASFRRSMQGLASGQPPVDSMIDGMMLMFAGGLFLVPGLLTDVAGMFLLIPPIRRAIGKWWLARMMARGTISVSTFDSRERYAGKRDAGPRGEPQQQRPASATGPIIDGEFERLDDQQRHKPGSEPRVPGSSGKP